MISRRVLIGTGLGVVAAGGAVIAADAAHRLDDVARTVGLDPKPLPDPRDTALMARVAEAQAALLAGVVAAASRHPALQLAAFEAIGREQLSAVGGTGAAPSSSSTPGSLRAAAGAGEAADVLALAYAAEAKGRASDAGVAVSPDLARVLASMSAGLVQCARAARSLA